MEKIRNLFLLTTFILFYSCSFVKEKIGSGSEIDVNDQAKPTLMIIPSDKLLKENGALQEENYDGVSHVVRDYSGYLLRNETNKIAISTIQKEFVSIGYPLNDLERTLKQINDHSLRDQADGIMKDAKTLLLESAQPDIILELDYSYNMDMNSRNFDRTVDYVLTAIDAYTNKVISAYTFSGGEGDNFETAFSSAIHKNINGTVKDIQKYFQDVVNNGREITVQFAITNGSNISFVDAYSSTGETYQEWIQDYMDYNTINGTYRLERNSDYQLYFTNVRIKNQNDNGTQLNALGWGRKCVKEMREKLGISCTNKSQGLSEVLITINGN